MGTRRSAHIVLLTAVALVACGDDDEESGSSPPAPASAAETSAAATAPTSAEADTEPTAAPGTAPVATDVQESSPPTTAADTVPAATEVEESSPPAAPGTGASNCSVTITGDVSAEWTSDASGFQAFVYGGWLNDPSAEDAQAFGLNCYDRDFNIVGFLATEGTEIPMRPATYELTASFDPNAPINADVALLFDEGLWETTSGTFEILEFDDAHIRGRFSLAIHDSFDDSRTAEVTGEFAHSR